MCKPNFVPTAIDAAKPPVYSKTGLTLPPFDPKVEDFDFACLPDLLFEEELKGLDDLLLNGSDDILAGFDGIMSAETAAITAVEPEIPAPVVHAASSPSFVSEPTSEIESNNSPYTSSPSYPMEELDNDFLATIFDCPPLPAASPEVRVGLKRKERSMMVEEPVAVPEKLMTVREKNREREKNRRNALKSCITACASYLPSGRPRRSLLKKEVLNGCANLLEEAKYLPAQVERSKYEVGLAIMKKQCVDDCIAMLLSRGNAVSR